MRVEKKYLIEEVAGHLRKSDYVILTNFDRMTVADVAELRSRLTAHKAEFHVVKNSSLRVAEGGCARQEADHGEGNLPTGRPAVTRRAPRPAPRSPQPARRHVRAGAQRRPARRRQRPPGENPDRRHQITITLNHFPNAAASVAAHGKPTIHRCRPGDTSLKRTSGSKSLVRGRRKP